MVEPTYIINVDDCIQFVYERVLDQVGYGFAIDLEPIRELVNKLFMSFVYGQAMDGFFESPFESLVADMTRGAYTAPLSSNVIDCILSYTNASFSLKVQKSVGQINTDGYQNIVWVGPTSFILENIQT